MKNLQPAFAFQGTRDVNRVVLMRELLQLVTDGALVYILDVVVLFGGVVAGLGALFEVPMEARGETRGANQPDRLLKKRVVVENAKDLQLDIGDAVEGVEQQAARAGIQRKCHGV